MVVESVDLFLGNIHLVLCGGQKEMEGDRRPVNRLWKESSKLQCGASSTRAVG